MTRPWKRPLMVPIRPIAILLQSDQFYTVPEWMAHYESIVVYRWSTIPFRGIVRLFDGRGGQESMIARN